MNRNTTFRYQTLLIEGRSSMKTLVTVYGVLNGIFFVFHAAFWWLFDWPLSLEYMAAEHRMLMQTFNLCMLPLFLFLTYAFLVQRDPILSTSLGRAVLMMEASIFFLRAGSEILFGDLHRGESQFFFVLCIILSVLFVVPLFRRRTGRHMLAES
jgi:hypothetical protein